MTSPSPRLEADFSPREDAYYSQVGAHDSADSQPQAGAASQTASDAAVSASGRAAAEGTSKRPLPSRVSTESKHGVSKQKLTRASMSQVPGKLHAVDKPLSKGLLNVTVRRSSAALSRQSISSSKAGMVGGWNPDVRLKVGKPDHKVKVVAADKTDAKLVRKSAVGSATDVRKSLSARSSDKLSDNGFR